MGILDLVIIIVIIFIIYMTFRKRSEGLDLAVNMRQYPHKGKFDDCYQIGTRYGFTAQKCKDMCNKMDSCVGISYGNPPLNECRLYNDTSLLKYDPRYISWFNFANRLIY